MAGAELVPLATMVQQETGPTLYETAESASGASALYQQQQPAPVSSGFGVEAPVEHTTIVSRAIGETTFDGFERSAANVFEL